MALMPTCDSAPWATCVKRSRTEPRMKESPCGPGSGSSPLSVRTVRVGAAATDRECDGSGEDGDP